MLKNVKLKISEICLKYKVFFSVFYLFNSHIAFFFLQKLFIFSNIPPTPFIFALRIRIQLKKVLFIRI